MSIREGNSGGSGEEVSAGKGSGEVEMGRGSQRLIENVE